MQERTRYAQTLCELFENEFLFSFLKLPLDRESGRPLDELMVQHRDSHFERSGHTHPVNFGQDISRKIGLGVEIEQPAQGISSRGMLIHGLPGIQRVGQPFREFQKLSGKQPSFAVQDWEKGYVVQVSVARR